MDRSGSLSWAELKRVALKGRLANSKIVYYHIHPPFSLRTHPLQEGGIDVTRDEVGDKSIAFPRFERAKWRNALNW